MKTTITLFIVLLVVIELIIIALVGPVTVAAKPPNPEPFFWALGGGVVLWLALCWLIGWNK